MHREIFNNILSIIMGRGFDLLLNFIAVTVIARYLGASQYGVFTSTVALVYILSKIIDFGFAQIVFREISSNKKDFSYLNNALSIRSVIFLLVVILYNIVAFLLSIKNTEVLFTNLLFLNIILSAKFQNFRELLEIPFKVNLKMNFVMLFNVIDNIVLISLILSVYFFRGNLFQIVIFYVISNIPGFILFIVFLIKKYKFHFQFTFDKSKWLMRESFPLFGAVLLFSLFQQLDVILLRSLVSSHSAGIYSAALRLAMPLGIMPLALITTVFPIITQNKNENKENVKKASLLVYKILFFFSFLSAIVVTFKAEDIIILIFGKNYMQASLPLVFIFWSYFFIFFNNFIQNVLTIYKNQNSNFTFSIITVSVNLFILGFVIVKYGAIGASVAKLIASGIGFSYLVYKLVKLDMFINFINKNSVLWSFLILIFLFIVKELNLFVFILFVSTTAISLLFFTKYFDKDEILILFKLLNEPKWFPQFLLK